MPKLLIVYFSRTGGAAQMAKAAHEAAKTEEGCETLLKRAEDAGPDDLLAADGYIFCAPENLAAIAGGMKEFFDRSYYPVLGKIEGRPYAQMICAGPSSSARTPRPRKTSSPTRRSARMTCANAANSAKPWPLVSQWVFSKVFQPPSSEPYSRHADKTPSS